MVRPEGGSVRHGEAGTVAQLDIGSRVRAARVRHGVSLRALSRELDISPATMSQVETGKSGLSVARLQQIAAALGMTADELLTLPADAPHPDADPSAPTPGFPDWRGYGPLGLDPVLQAALAVFVRTGYHGATVRDVARECGRSVSGIYHHYPSKHEMLRRILDLGVTELLCRAEAARSEGTDPAERFSLVVESLVLFHIHRREVGFLGASEMRSLEPDARRDIAARRTHLQRILDVEALAAAAAGRFRTPRPVDAARAVVTMCTSIPLWFKPGGVLTPAEIAEQYGHYALGVMLADQPDPQRRVPGLDP